MTDEQFEISMRPLVDRWPKAFPNSIMERVFSHVRDLDMVGFDRIVKTMLDTQRAAPLPKDFLEAASATRKRYFNYQTEQAAKSLSSKNLKDILAENGYNGCDSVLDAVNEEVFKNQIKKADQSDF